MISTFDLYRIDAKALKNMTHHKALLFQLNAIPEAKTYHIQKRNESTDYATYSKHDNMLKKIDDARVWLGERIEEME